jgi:hypothetical protein
LKENSGAKGLRDEYRLRVFEIRMLRKLCGPTGKEVIGGSRKCVTRNLMIFNPHHILLRKIRRAGRVASEEINRNAYGTLVGKPEEKETTSKT